MKRVRRTPKTHADWADVEDCYGPLDQDFADGSGRKAFAAAGFLADYPHVRNPLAAGTRKWRVRGTRHQLIYRVDRLGVQILRVRHGHENRLADF